MNAGELREAIKDVPDDVTVVMAKDGEGNAFHELSEVDTTSLWDDENDEVVDPADPDFEDEGDYGPVVVLWPFG